MKLRGGLFAFLFCGAFVIGTFVLKQDRPPSDDFSALSDTATTLPSDTSSNLGESVATIYPSRQLLAQPSSSISDEQIARAIIDENAKWIFLHDKHGNRLRDSNGNAMLTPLGNQYLEYIRQANQQGVTGSLNQHTWAIVQLSSESDTDRNDDRTDGYSSSSSAISTFSRFIESRIDGDFEGWERDKIFKLINGQIWQQRSFDYRYQYSYRPEVLIYRSGFGWKMLVIGMSKPIRVVQLK